MLALHGIYAHAASLLSGKAQSDPTVHQQTNGKPWLAPPSKQTAGFDTHPMAPSSHCSLGSFSSAFLRSALRLQQTPTPLIQRYNPAHCDMNVNARFGEGLILM